MSDNPFDKVEEKKTKKGHTDPLAGMDKKKVHQATDTGKSIKHGRLHQLNTRVPEQVIDLIREWADRLELTQQDLQRWCFYHGLQALEDGTRPETVEVKKTVKPPADLLK